MSRRKIFFLAFCALFILEYCITKYVHDDFIRPYLGDVLVVLLLYCFAQTLLPRPIKGLAGLIFTFACLVEFSQFFSLVDRLHLSEYPILKIILGSTFDWQDIFCYFLGCCFLWPIERYLTTTR